MALKNRLGIGVFTFQGSTIKLQSTLSRLEALSAATGVGGMEFIEQALLSGNPGELTTMFYHLQYGSEYSRDEIHGAFFGRVDDIQSEEWQEAFASCYADLLGIDKAALIKPAKDDTQKKTAD